MIVERKTHRRRLVKGWAFGSLSDEEKAAVERFLETGDTAVLPRGFVSDQLVATVVAEKLPTWAD